MANAQYRELKRLAKTGTVQEELWNSLSAYRNGSFLWNDNYDPAAWTASFKEMMRMFITHGKAVDDVLYRGVKIPKDVFQPGVRLPSPMLTSWTRGLHLASRFSTTERVILRLRPSAVDAKMLPLVDIMIHEGLPMRHGTFDEVLLPPGYICVLGHEEIDDMYVVDCVFELDATMRRTAVMYMMRKNQQSRNYIMKQYDWQRAPRSTNNLAVQWLPNSHAGSHAGSHTGSNFELI